MHKTIQNNKDDLLIYDCKSQKWYWLSKAGKYQPANEL